jgi:hypothetical protein
MYFYYLDIFNQRKPVPSVHLLNLQISETGDDQFRATIAVEQTDPSITGDLFLHTALTESHIPEVWLGGLTEVNFVCRGMYPSSTGTPLDFSGSNTREVTVDFSTAGLSLRNCEFIAFVQSMPGLEIMQTTRASLRDFDKEISPEAFSIYPNPVNERLTITVNTDEPLSFEITDMLGRIVYPVHEIAGNREVIDVSLWKRGFYIIRTNDGTSKKIVVAGKNISGTP